MKPCDGTDTDGKQDNTGRRGAMNVKQRWIYGFTGFLVLIFLGMIYAWSIFIRPLESEFGWIRSQTSAIFSISMIFFCVGNLAAGVITPRTSPRISIFIAACAIFAGFFASSFTSGLVWIYVSYGVLCGFAVGIGANTVLSTSLKWFADKQGMASGTLLMGFGFGSMVLSPFVTMMLGRLGWRSTFKLLSIVFGLLLMAGAVILRNPPKEVMEILTARGKKKNILSQKNYTAGEMLRTRAFWLFFLWLILLASGGLALIGNAVPAAQDVLYGTMEEQEALLLATTAMGTISVFNGLGRFGTGIIWDRKGFRAALTVISGSYILSMVLLALSASMGIFPVLVAGFILLGAAYGGSMSVGSAMIGSFFGQLHYSMNYACATCNLIVAALIGPTAAGMLQTSYGSYLTSYYLFLALGIVSMAVAMCIRKPQEVLEETVVQPHTAADNRGSG